MITTSNDLIRAIEDCLKATDSKFTEREIVKDARRCRDDMYADCEKFDGKIEDPFFTFWLLDNVAVFTIFEDPFEIIIFRFQCHEVEFIPKFNEIAMCDVDKCRKCIADVFGVTSANIQVPRWLAETWMEQC